MKREKILAALRLAPQLAKDLVELDQLRGDLEVLKASIIKVRDENFALKQRLNCDPIIEALKGGGHMFNFAMRHSVIDGAQLHNELRISAEENGVKIQLIVNGKFSHLREMTYKAIFNQIPR